MKELTPSGEKKLADNDLFAWSCYLMMKHGTQDQRSQVIDSIPKETRELIRQSYDADAALATRRVR